MTDKKYEDLVKWVTTTLTELRHPNPKEWEDKLSVTKEIHPGEPLEEYQQIFKINRALRYLLGESRINTFEIRFMIIDGDDVDSWKHLLKTKVLPFIVDNNI